MSWRFHHHVFIFLWDFMMNAFVAKLRQPCDAFRHFHLSSFSVPGGYIPTLETKQRECWKFETRDVNSEFESRVSVQPSNITIALALGCGRQAGIFLCRPFTRSLVFPLSLLIAPSYTPSLSRHPSFSLASLFLVSSPTLAIFPKQPKYPPVVVMGIQQTGIWRGWKKNTETKLYVILNLLGRPRPLVYYFYIHKLIS